MMGKTINDYGVVGTQNFASLPGALGALQSLRGLGYVASKRTVRPMPSWARDLVPKPKGITVTIKSNEDTERDTLPFIISTIKRTAHQTEKLAHKFKGTSVEETTRKIWQFIFDHVKFVEDSNSNEQVRDPNRTIHEAKGDCDCMVVLAGSLLYNLKIPFLLRIFKQHNASDPWGHIYILVPAANRFIVLDCVADSFNYEVPHVQHKDYKDFMALQSLQGVGAQDCSKSNSRKFALYERAQQYRDRGMVIAEEFFKQHAVPFTTVEDQQYGYGFLVGRTFVPPVITKAQAAQLLNPEVQTPVENENGEKKNWTWLWWLLGGAAATYALTSNSKPV